MYLMGEQAELLTGSPRLNIFPCHSVSGVGGGGPLGFLRRKDILEEVMVCKREWRFWKEGRVETLSSGLQACDSPRQTLMDLRLYILHQVSVTTENEWEKVIFA